MKKALIIFGSTTGNTEEMADIIKDALDESGFETEMKNVIDSAVEDLTSDNGVILIGCPAYGDDTIELQEDFQEFYEQIDGIQLNGKRYAVFAPGDSTYEFFCGSVDMLEDRMNELGGIKVIDGLKVDGDPADEKEQIVQWAKSVADLDT